MHAEHEQIKPHDMKLCTNGRLLKKMKSIMRISVHISLCALAKVQHFIGLRFNICVH